MRLPKGGKIARLTRLQFKKTDKLRHRGVYVSIDVLGVGGRSGISIWKGNESLIGSF